MTKNFMRVVANGDKNMDFPANTYVDIVKNPSNASFLVKNTFNGENICIITPTPYTGSVSGFSTYAELKEAVELNNGKVSGMIEGVVDENKAIKFVGIQLTVEVGGKAVSGSGASSTGTKEYLFKVKGLATQHTAKIDVINYLRTDAENGELEVELKYDEAKKILVTYHKDKSAGEIKRLASFTEEDEMNYEELVTLIKNDEPKHSITVTAKNPSQNAYDISFSIEQEVLDALLSGKKIETVDSVINGITFVNKERLKAIKKYLEGNKLNPEQIIKVFKTMREYDEEATSRIPTNPKTLYEDSFGGVKKSIIYMLKGKHLNMTGEKGTGKNVMITTLAWVFQRPLYEVSLNSEFDKYDLLGSKDFQYEKDEETGQTIQKIGFAKEAFVQAMESGGIINLDEVNTANPAVLVQLHSVVDDRGSIQVPHLGRVVAKDNFAVILTMNKDYHGTNALNEATNDRFTPILFPNNDSLKDVLNKRVPGAKYSQISDADKVYKDILEQVRNGVLDKDCITVRGYIDALEVADDLGLGEALVDNVANRIQDDGFRKDVLNIIDNHIGGVSNLF